VRGRTNEGVVALPAPGLRSVVGSYRGYRLLGAPGVHRGLPSSTLTFVLSLADPVDVRGLGEQGRGSASAQAFVAGLHLRPARIHHDGVQYGIQLDVTPLGARRLFGVPAGVLAQSLVDLDDLFGAGSAQLLERLACAPGWRERFSILDETLLQRLTDAAVAQTAVVEAWVVLARSGGSMTVSALAAAVGYSRRHLVDLFRQELGLPPKAAARVFRFERSRELMSRRPRSSLAAIAAAVGYFDQAHMDHEWSALAGCAPSVWLAHDLPFVQDDDGGVGASSLP
jgi:AraC-like DNA-binding protein